MPTGIVLDMALPQYVIIDGHHRFLSWKSAQAALPEDKKASTIPVRVLEGGLSKNVIVMISMALNFKNERTLPMNLAGICSAVSKMVGAGYSGDEIQQGTGGTKITATSVPHYQMVYTNFAKKNCFKLFEYICNQVSHTENPLKLHILVKSMVNKASPFALRGWMLEVAKKAIRNFVPPENIYEPAAASLQEMEVTLSQTGMSEADEEDGDVPCPAQPSPSGKSAKKQTGKVKLMSVTEIEATLSKWQKRSDFHTMSVECSKTCAGRFADADLQALQERVRLGAFDSISLDDPRWKTALHRVFRNGLEVSEEAIEETDEDSDSESDRDDAAPSTSAAPPAKHRAGIKRGSPSAPSLTMTLDNSVEFRAGDSLALNHFSSSFLSWSENKRAQLCLCDPPWGITGARHDRAWTNENWMAFAREVNSSMRDDVSSSCSFPTTFSPSVGRSGHLWLDFVSSTIRLGTQTSSQSVQVQSTTFLRVQPHFSVLEDQAVCRQH